MEPSNPNIFQQKFLILREMELSDPKIKKILIFSLKRILVYFEKWNLLTELLVFQGGTF